MKGQHRIFLMSGLQAKKFIMLFFACRVLLSSNITNTFFHIDRRLIRPREYSLQLQLQAIKGLLTSFARSVRESSCLRFSYKPSDEGARSVRKREGKYFPVQTEQTRLIRHLLYGFWFIFFSVYSAVQQCCRLRTLPLTFLVSLHVYTRQAFIWLAYFSILVYLLSSLP